MNPGLAVRIAWRQILSSSNSGFVRTVSLLSVTGIAIGVAALVILDSFMDGFSDTILQRLSSISAPMEVRIPGGQVFGPEELASAREILDTYPQVTGVSPVLEKTVVIAGRSGDVAGVKMRGIDWAVEPELVSGDRLMDIDVPPGTAVLGTLLAQRLNVTSGDTVRLASTDVTQFSSIGRLLVDTIVAVPVSEVLDLGIQEYNSSVLLTDLQTASTLFREPVSATILSVGIADGADPVATADSISASLRNAYVHGEMEFMLCDSFLSSNRNLFAALGLEKTGMAIVLALIAVVALLNLLSALTMIAIEHRRDTGVLRSMGASPGMVLMTGLFQGGIIAAGGVLLGSVFAVTVVAAINKFFPIRLESSVYWVDTFSGRIEPMMVLGISLVTLLACLAASIFPAVRAMAVNPSEAVRYE